MISFASMVPFLEIVALFAGTASALVAIWRLWGSTRTRRLIVRFARGNAEFQSVLAGALSDRVVDDDEARNLSRVIVSQIRGSQDIDGRSVDNVKAFVKDVEHTREHRFYNDLAKEIDLRIIG